MTARQRQARMRILYDLQEGVCPFCTIEVVHPDDARRERAMNEGWAPSLEHVITRRDRGSDHITNLLLAHRDCNNDRGHAKLPNYVRMFHRKILVKISQNRDRIEAAIAPLDEQP